MKKFLLFSVLLLILVGFNNRLSAQVENFYHPTWGLLAITGDSRLVTHIKEVGDEVHIEALVIGYCYLGTVEYSLYYDKDVVFPINGAGGPEITTRKNGHVNMDKYFALDTANLGFAHDDWRMRTDGDLHPLAASPYTFINTGGIPLNPMSYRIVQAGEIFRIFKLHFRKKPGQEISSNTFTYYEKLTPPPLHNDYNLGVPLFVQMSGTQTIATNIRTHVFARRIRSDVFTLGSSVSGTSVTLSGLAEIVNRDVVMVPTDVSGQRGGLDWDTILTTGFIYSKNNIAMSVGEYSKTLKIAGTDYNFPDAIEIAAGTFTRGAYTFNIVSTPNTAKSYDINMSETVSNLDPVSEYCAYSFLLYRFQTSDPYPVLGTKTCFTTGCDPAIPPTVTTPHTICATTPPQTLASIPVAGTAIQWYADEELTTPLPLTHPLQDETIYFVTQTINGCESDPSSVTVFIVTQFDAPEIASPQYFCTTSFTLADIALPAGVTVKWYDAEDEGDEIPAGTGITNGTTYWAAAVQGDCESVARTPVMVIVNANPEGPEITTPQYFCEGAVLSSIDVSPYNPADIIWYEDSDGLVVITNMATPLTSGSYYAALNIGASCISGLTQVVVDINPTNADFDTDQYISCENVKLTDIPISGWGIKWFSEEEMENELDPSIAYPSGTYYAANSFGFCLIPNMAVTIIVYDNVPPPTLNASANNRVCDKEQICLAFVLGLINQQPGFDYRIYTNSACTTLFTGCITASYTSSPHVFYARAFVAGMDCGSDVSGALQIDVVVDPLPAAPTLNAAANNSICEGVTITQAFLEGLVNIAASTTVTFYTDIACTTPFTPGVAVYANTPYTFYALAQSTITTCTTDPSNATAVTVNVIEAPELPTIDATNNGTLCDGANVMMYVSNQDAYTSPIYQWYAGLTELTGETNPYYVTNVTGTFTVTVFDGGCYSTSAVYTVTDGGTFLYPPPAIQATNNAVLCADANVMLYITNGNVYGATATYQWYKEGVPLTGETNTYLIVDESGFYSIEVIVGACSMVSNGIDVTVSPEIFNYIQPELVASNDGVLCGDANVLLYLNNGDIYEGATYSWFKDGLPLGLTTPYIIVNTAGWYHVEVIIGDCSMLSNGVQVTISGGDFDGPSPVIAGTNNAVLCTDANVMLYLTNADAYTNPTYQWYYEGYPIANAEDPYLIVSEDGAYHLEVIIGLCSALSNGIDVTISGDEFDLDRPIVEATNNDVICQGANVLLYITNGHLYLNAGYQWFKDGLLIPSATNSYLIVNSEGVYHVEVTMGTCSMVSAGKQVTENEDPFNGAAPVIAATNNAVLCGDANVMLYLTNASTYTNPTYQWYYEGTPITGANNSYIIVDNDGFYHIEVMIGSCSMLSNGIEVTLSGEDFDFDPPILAATNDGSICDGANVMLYIENGDLYVNASYQWFKNGLPIASATNPYLVVNSAGIYHVEVTIGSCSRVSNGVEVTEDGDTFNYPQPVIAASTTSPLCENANVLLYISNVDAYENTNAEYQWFYEGVLLTGATNSFLVANQAGVYHVVVSINGCTVASTPFTVVGSGEEFEYPQPILEATNDGIICANANVMLYIANGDAFENAIYRWYLNGVLLVGETDAYLIVEEPGLYLVEVIIGGCSMVSNAVRVQITNHTFDYERPEITATNGGVLCEDRSITLSIANEDEYIGTGATYQWFLDGFPITDATDDTYETLEIGDYHVEVIIGECSMVSDIFTVTYKDRCGVTVLGTVFPFMKHTDNEDLSDLFVITVSLKAIPENPETFDPDDLLNAEPLYGPVDAVYYDGTTFVPGTPQFSGIQGYLNNYGVPINFQDAIGKPHVIPVAPFLDIDDPAAIDINTGTTVGLYRMEEVLAGDYILEIYREGYIVRWAKVTIDDNIPINYMDHREIIPGDINDDMAINNNDANELIGNVGAVFQDPTSYLPMVKYDLDGDGRVVNNDLSLLIIYTGFRYYHYVDTQEWLDELGIEY